jgi:hypothetical protein
MHTGNTQCSRPISLEAAIAYEMVWDCCVATILCVDEEINVDTKHYTE